MVEHPAARVGQRLGLALSGGAVIGSAVRGAAWASTRVAIASNIAASSNRPTSLPPPLLR